MTNSSTPETPRMTAEDARQVQVLLEATGGMQIGGRYARILATYHALSASQQEVADLKESIERWRKTSTELHDALCDTRASLALAQKDTRRLDYLFARRDVAWLSREGIDAAIATTPTPQTEEGNG